MECQNKSRNVRLHVRVARSTQRRSVSAHADQGRKKRKLKFFIAVLKLEFKTATALLRKLRQPSSLTLRHRCPPGERDRLTHRARATTPRSAHSKLLVAAAERRAAPHAAARAPPAAACRPRRLCNRAHRRTRRRRCRTRTVGCAGIHGLVRTRAGPGTPLLPLAVQTTLRSRRSFKWSFI